MVHETVIQSTRFARSQHSARVESQQAITSPKYCMTEASNMECIGKYNLRCNSSIMSAADLTYGRKSGEPKSPKAVVAW
jgi:hypothetical protein